MPIQYAGGTNVSATFTGDSRQAIMSNILAQLLTAGWSNQSGATGSGTGPGKVATFTVTIASPGVVTLSGHGFNGGERVILQTTGALPTGLSVNTVYFVKFIDANTFNLATTLGGANINTSGSQSGTHTLNTESILVQTAATTQSLALRCRIKDNRGNCVQFSIENTTALLVGNNSTTQGGNLLPAASKTFRIIANKYQFLVMVPGVFNTARNLVFVSCPYIPAPNTVPADAGIMICDSLSDTSTTLPSNWRNVLGIVQNTLPNFQVMWGASIWENSNNTFNNASYFSCPNFFVGAPAVAAQMGYSTGGVLATYRWASNQIITSDPLLQWGLSAFGDEPMLRAQLWDALLIHNSYSGDVTTTFDSHNWRTVTNNNAGSSGQHPRGTLIVVEP